MFAYASVPSRGPYWENKFYTVKKPIDDFD